VYTGVVLCCLRVLKTSPLSCPLLHPPLPPCDNAEIKQDNDKLRNDIRQDNNKIKDEISKLTATFKYSSGQGNTGNRIGTGSNKFSSVTCFSCNQKGHTNRFCKEKKGKPGPVGSYSENSKRDGGSSAFDSFNKPRNELNG